MEVPNLLALSLEEAEHRLQAAGMEFEVQLLLPPRDSEEDFAGKPVRKYVVRQQVLSANKVGLTIVYRLGKEVHVNGSEN